MSQEIQSKINKIANETEFEGITHEEVADVLTMINLDKVGNQEFKNSIDSVKNEVSQNLQGYLKIADPKPTVAGKYELVGVGTFANLIPNIKPGETTPTNTPITTKVGYFNTVFFDGTNFTFNEIAIPSNPAKAPQWVAGTYTAGTIVYDLGVTYRVKNSSATTTERPSPNATTWESISGVLSLYLSLVESGEFVATWVDKVGNIVFGIRSDGSLYSVDIEAMKSEINKFPSILASIKELQNSPAVKSIKEISNTEYIKAVTDSNGFILYAVKSDGTFWSVTTEELSRKINEINNKFLNLYFPPIKEESSLESIELTRDKEGRKIRERDISGKLIEYVGVETPNLKVTENLEINGSALKDLEASLKADGFSTGVGDWSDVEDLELPFPRALAKINITGNRLPTTKTDNVEGTFEYWDKDGNYFKCFCINNAQGNSTMAYHKKNMSIDLFSDAEFEESKAVKFGHMVAADGFHIKAFYVDNFVGVAIVSYRLVEDLYQARPFGHKKPYEKYLWKSVTPLNGSGKDFQDFGSDALCHPDGFPVEIYFNGKYYGLFVFALSKKKENYEMKKGDKNHIILDGNLDSTTIFNGTVDWTQFEIRNPKTLKDINGFKYNGDNPKELSDTDTLSSAVKSRIQRLSNSMAIIKAGATLEERQSLYHQYYDLEEMIDYILYANVVMNFDGFAKNWIWCTWDGNIWSPTGYDHDSIFGRHFSGRFIYEAVNIVDSTILGSQSALPSGLVFAYFRQNLNARYKDLRDRGIFTSDYIVEKLREWTGTIGIEGYRRNIEAFPETPSYRESYINTTFWKKLKENTFSTINYDNTKTYNVGDRCYYGKTEGWGFQCIATSLGNPPITKFYNDYPNELGMFDSIPRVKAWLDVRLTFLDTYFNYNK